MADSREIKSKQFIDENGIIDGSGTSGLIRSNNSKFEANIGDWVEYTDAAQAIPEDGIGSAAADVTLERTEFTSEVLDGNGSMKITKANLANAQGQGVSLTIPVPKANRSQPHKLSFDFSSTANFTPANPADPITTPGDIGVYLYDVTNSKLLTPNQPYITAGSGRYESLLQLPSNCEEVRVILHVQSTSTDLYVLFVDNVKLDIAPNQTIKNASDEFEYTPTFTGLGTPSASKVFYSIHGDKMKVRGEVTSGTVTAAAISISLPSGYNLSTVKSSGDRADAYGVAYRAAGTSQNIASTAYGPWAITNNTSVATNAVYVAASTNSTTGSFNPTNGSTILNSGDKLTFEFEVPVQGLTSGVSHPAAIGLNAKAIMRANKNDSGTWTADTTIPSWTTVFEDSVNGFNASTGVYTVKSPGDYYVHGLTYQVGASTNAAFIYLNGVRYAHGDSNANGVLKEVNAFLPNLKYGDEITLRNSLSATNQSIGDTSGTTFEIFKIGSEKQPYAPRTVYLKHTGTSGTLSGTFTSGSYQTRPINSRSGDLSFSTLSANQFTLDSGTYQIEAEVPAYACELHKAKLRNITDAVDTILGSSAYSTLDGGGFLGTDQTHSKIYGQFSINSIKTFEIQHRCSVTRANNGFGVTNTFGDDELWTQVKITKIL